MFNQIDVYFNQKLLSPPNNASIVKTFHLISCLLDADISDYVDDTLDSSNPNTALERRA